MSYTLSVTKIVRQNIGPQGFDMWSATSVTVKLQTSFSCWKTWLTALQAPESFISWDSEHDKQVGRQVGEWNSFLLSVALTFSQNFHFETTV